MFILFLDFGALYEPEGRASLVYLKETMRCGGLPWENVDVSGRGALMTYVICPTRGIHFKVNCALIDKWTPTQLKQYKPGPFLPISLAAKESHKWSPQLLQVSPSSMS